MTRLIAMDDVAFSIWKSQAITAYAEDKARVLNISAQAARELAETSFADLLPDGLNTADAHIYTILNSAGDAVGALWFNVQRQWGQTKCFIFDIVVQPEHRRKGHGRGALNAMVPIAASLGASSIGLHVFADNPGAITLYESCGFETTDLIMALPVATP